MKVTAIDHLNIAAPAAVIASCRDFYRDIIGLADGFRPPFASDGYWLYAGDRAIVHLVISDAGSAGAAGYFGHVALSAEGLTAFEHRLRSAGIEYRKVTVPATSQIQLFLTDPAGIAVELNFAGA